jgi:hypothetical protein
MDVLRTYRYGHNDSNIWNNQYETLFYLIHVLDSHNSKVISNSHFWTFFGAGVLGPHAGLGVFEKTTLRFVDTMAKTMTYEMADMGHSYFKHIYNPSTIQKSFEMVILWPSWFRAAYGPKSGRALEWG